MPYDETGDLRFSSVWWTPVVFLQARVAWAHRPLPRHAVWPGWKHGWEARWSSAIRGILG